jgi:hypothetical protein
MFANNNVDSRDGYSSAEEYEHQHGEVNMEPGEIRPGKSASSNRDR